VGTIARIETKSSNIVKNFLACFFKQQHEQGESGLCVVIVPNDFQCHCQAFVGSFIFENIIIIYYFYFFLKENLCTLSICLSATKDIA
jgi:hypothetical protein